MKKKNKNICISVAGVMGSGKTTMAKLIAQELGHELFEERVKENIFLPLYYKDPKRWALHSQFFYLKEKMSQLKVIGGLLDIMNVVQDVPVYQDAFAYAKAQHQLGYMSKKEYKLYLSLLDTYKDTLPTPDLIVQLNASTPSLLGRIKKRARPYEKTIDPEYLDLLSNLQKQWITEHKHLNVFEVDTDNPEYNITEEKGKNNLIKSLKKKIKEFK